MNSSEFRSEAAEDVATELGVSAGMVEKEWHAVRVAWAAVGVPSAASRFSVAFGGGTSLSAAHGLIERFSEDVDIRLSARHGSAVTANEVVSYCQDLTGRLASLGYQLDAIASRDYPEHSSSRRAYRYENVLRATEEIRPYVKVDVSAAACSRPLLFLPIRSRLDRALGTEMGPVPCVSPLETAADKLSALAWRVCDGSAARKPQTMRHLYDIHSLASIIASNRTGFADAVLGNLSRDVQRINLGRNMFRPLARDVLTATPRALGSGKHKDNYMRFAQAFAFGARPSFEEAVETLLAIVTQVCR